MNKKIFTLSLAAMLLFSGFLAKASDIKGHIETDANKAKYKANTIVYIEKVNGSFKPPAKNPELNQKNLTFLPRVLPVLAGTTVNFLNNDDVLHNVFSPDGCAGKFNLGSWKKGEVRTRKFDQPGCNACILCNVHPEMAAFVVVLQNPYFALTDNDGNFVIKNVPPGKYKLMVWNEKLKSAPQEINITAGGKNDVVFKLAK
jgi:plastocyanin